MQRVAIALVASFLVGLAALGIWLAQRQPRNQDGYPYRDHLHTAQMASAQGTIHFNDTRLDTFAIYMRGDTLFVEAPDTLYILPGTTNPSIPLPFYYTRTTPIAQVLLLDLRPDQFYSMYKFPNNKWEIWEGTKPGGDPAANVTDSADVYITLEKDLLFGWQDSTQALTDTTQQRTTYPRQAAIYDTENNVFIKTDSIPKAVRDTTLWP